MHIDELGCTLARYPRHRLKGSAHFRLRGGYYRIIHAFDIVKNEIHLHALGHRPELHR